MVIPNPLPRQRGPSLCVAGEASSDHSWYAWALGGLNANFSNWDDGVAGDLLWDLLLKMLPDPPPACAFLRVFHWGGSVCFFPVVGGLNGLIVITLEEGWLASHRVG